MKYDTLLLSILALAIAVAVLSGYSKRDGKARGFDVKIRRKR